MMEFITKRGTRVQAAFRDDTSDWNTLLSCLREDEYGFTEREWSGIAVDVGAHIGGATLALLADNPDLHVVAIEALPENAEMIHTNLALNGWEDRCTVLNRAASSDQTEVTMAYGATTTEFERHHRFIGGAVWEGHGPTGEQVTIPGVSLSDVIAEHGPMALMKIDAEGAEWSFLDDKAIADVQEVRGEYHPTVPGDIPTRLRGLLEPTHTVSLDDKLQFGPFRAVRR